MFDWVLLQSTLSNDTVMEKYFTPKSVETLLAKTITQENKLMVYLKSASVPSVQVMRFLIDVGNDPKNIAFLHHDAATLIEFAVENAAKITPEIIDFIAPYTEAEQL